MVSSFDESPNCCRYRGIHESNDVGVKVSHTDPRFADWNRMWDIWHNKELTSAFKTLALRHGLKVRSLRPWHEYSLLVVRQDDVIIDDVDLRLCSEQCGIL
jgi:hypothetical protein